MASRTIAFLLGIVLFQCQSQLPGAAVWWVLAAIALVACAWRWARPHSAVNLLVVAVLFALAGFGWAAVRALPLLAERLPSAWEGEELRVVGVIRDLPEANGERTRFDLQPERVAIGDQWRDYRGRLRLFWPGAAPALHAGDRWQLTVRLKRPHGFANPGGFDYETSLFERRIAATGYVRAKGDNRLVARGARFAVDGWRNRLRERMRAALGDAPHGGVLIALAIGDGSSIAPHEWDLFRATGTTHLMAISGLHVGMVALLAAWAARRLWRAPRLIHRLPAPKVAALAGLAAAFSYGLLAGFSVPTQRTVVTIAAVVIALLAARVTHPALLLALACWAVLLYDPLAVVAPGFWLSFGAVALLLYGLGGRLEQRGLAWKWGRLQWVLGIGLTPLLIAFFGAAALVSPIANLIAVPWISLVVVPLTLLGAGVITLWPALGAALLQLAAWLLGLLWPLLVWLAEKVPLLPLATPPLWAFGGVLIGIALLLAPRGWPGRWLGLFWCLPLLLWQPPRPAEGEVWFTLLDVGQGLAAVIETRAHVAVFDTGPSLGPDRDAGSAVVEPFLRYRGWRAVDTLVVSHGDDDHAGGVRSLVSALPPRRVLAAVPHALLPLGLMAEACRRGTRWRWEEIDFELLHPEIPDQANDGSCVLRVAAPGGAILLTGDIEAAAERTLVAQGEALRARVLVVPHHGSKSSSTAAFIDAVGPEVALFPVGYRNRYRFPSATITARYEARHIRRLDTAREGAVSLRLTPDGALTQASWRASHRRYWQEDESLGGRTPIW